MHRNFLAVLLLAGSGLAGQAMAQTTARGPDQISTVKRSQDLDRTIAVALIGAISGQLGGRAVDMRLDSVDIEPVKTRNREIRGTGGVRIDGDDAWVGFRFLLVYDSERRVAGYPEVSLAGVSAGERNIPNDASLVRQLETKVIAALSKQFRKQSISLRLDRIATVQSGSQYLRINADGLAYLGAEGSKDMTIEALYDRSSGRWLRLHYGLGEDAGYSSGQPTASR